MLALGAVRDLCCDVHVAIATPRNKVLPAKRAKVEQDTILGNEEIAAFDWVLVPKPERLVVARCVPDSKVVKALLSVLRCGRFKNLS